MPEGFPSIEFKIGRQRIPMATRKWLAKKTEYLTNIWLKKGSGILHSIEEQCGFGFPAKTISEGMVVYLFQYKNDDGLGDMDETQPLECNLYVRKSDSWRDIKAPLVHELIHCLMWQKVYFDLRIGKPTFFGDVFADELMASVVECLVLGRKPSYDTCDDAIDYALEEAVARLIEDTDDRKKLVEALMVFFEEYRLKMKNKESNILKERERVLARLPSLVPESID
jgi:hypothetical protein